MGAVIWWFQIFKLIVHLNLEELLVETPPIATPSLPPARGALPPQPRDPNERPPPPSSRPPLWRGREWNEYIYMYIYICMYVCMHVCMYACINVMLCYVMLCYECMYVCNVMQCNAM